MTDSSKNKKELLSKELDDFIINYKRKTGFFPGAINISDKEASIIRDLIAEYMSKNTDSQSYFYECSNNPEIDTLLVFAGIDMVITENANEYRDFFKD